ncbi:MAG: STAS domain-containing protein [Phycisphaerales bacterium]|nr:STAS domain-containing protein [Phycisphaerales bacterium]
MELKVEKLDNAVVVSPTGDIDLSCSRDFQQWLKKSLESRPPRLIVDLANVPYMDSSGVATLVEAMQIARRQSTKLVLSGLQPKVRSIFEIARLDRVFTLAADLNQAQAI